MPLAEPGPRHAAAAEEFVEAGWVVGDSLTGGRIEHFRSSRGDVAAKFPPPPP